LPPAVECLLWSYAFGKPKDTVEVNVARKVIHILPPLQTKVEPEPKELPAEEPKLE
jgi:hypothetical protein